MQSATNLIMKSGMTTNLMFCTILPEQTHLHYWVYCKRRLIGQLGHNKSKELGIVHESPLIDYVAIDGTGRENCQKWCERVKRRIEMENAANKVYTMSNECSICLENKCIFKQCSQCHQQFCSDC